MNTESNPLPRWTSWLAAVVIVIGYGVLEAQDAQVERTIAQAKVAKVAVAQPQKN